MNKITKRIFSLVLCVICVFACTVPVFADTVDTSKTGSISIDIHAYGTDDAVGGGSLSLYKIADVASENSYSYTFDFTGCDASLLTQEKLNLASTAETFAVYASDKSILAVGNVEVDSKGEASFSNLSLGLYMIVQTTAATGYEAINPFLVTVPVLEDGVYVYDVNATPKTQGASTEHVKEVTKYKESTNQPKVVNNPQSTDTPKSSTDTKSTDNSKSASNAKTNDTSQLIGWLIVLAAAIAGVVVVIIRRRRLA